jgi:hypothetical protein
MRLWTDKTWRKCKGKRRWATLRVKRDGASGEDYFDVLLGRVGEPWHAHLGIALDQSLLFQEDRGLIGRMGRRMESRQKGLIEERNSIVSPDVPPGADLILKLDVNPSTGQVTVLDFGIAE